jgi:CRP-like cAMP-binding protein
MLFAKHNYFPVDVTTLTDCEVLYINKDSLLEQFKENERFLQSFLAFTSNRAQFLSNRIQFMLLATIKGKIAHYILKQPHNNLFFQLDRSITALADYFGVARPSLSRALSEMAHDGIINIHHRKGTILNLNALKELVK